MSSFRGKPISQPAMPYISSNTMLPPPVSHVVAVVVFVCIAIDYSFRIMNLLCRLECCRVVIAAIESTATNTCQCVPIGAAALCARNTIVGWTAGNWGWCDCQYTATVIFNAKYSNTTTANGSQIIASCPRARRPSYHRVCRQHQRTGSRADD